jgi:hypothetical protein
MKVKKVSMLCQSGNIRTFQLYTNTGFPLEIRSLGFIGRLEKYIKIFEV